MRYLLPLFVVLFWQGAQGQSKPFRFGLAIGPNWSNTIQTGSGAPASSGAVFGDFKNGKGGYQILLFAEHHIHPRVAVRMGLGYANTGSKLPKRPLLFAVPEPGLPTAAQFSFVHTDILTPLHLRFDLNKDQRRWFVIGGLSPSFKSSRKIKKQLWFLNGQRETSTADDTGPEFRDMNVNATLGFGCDLNLGNNLHLLIQPSLDVNLWGTTLRTSGNERIFSVGLNIGVLL